MKTLFALFVWVSFLACSSLENDNNPDSPSVHPLHHISSFTSDSLVNVVIEIPAGTNQKWELNKETGQIEWEQIAPDTFRTIDFLPYPANYGFVPQTLLPKSNGGDGDPVDVFVLGSSMARSYITQVKIVGIIHMLDANQSDSKLLAVNVADPVMNIRSYDMLNDYYPGVLDILQLWLLNYKGPNQVKIISVNNEQDAMLFLERAHQHYINNKP